MWNLLGVSAFERELLLLKVKRLWNFGSVSKNKRRHKKRHGHNNEFWCLKRIAGPTNHVRRPFYSFQTSKLDIVAVSFFFDASFRWNFFFDFHLTLTANKSGLKPSKLKNYNIFGILRTSAFSWYTLFTKQCLGHTSGKHWEKSVFVSRVLIKNRAFQQGALYCT